MKKHLAVLFLVLATLTLTVPPALAEEEMSPAKKKLLEKARKDSAAAKAVLESGPGQSSMLDLNKASKQQLMTLPGIGEAEADKIIAARPYHTKMQLKKQELIPLETFYGIMDKVEVVVEIKKYEPPTLPKAPKTQNQGAAKDKPKRDLKDVFK